MVDVQIPLKYVEPSIASRIEWVHGNLYVLILWRICWIFMNRFKLQATPAIRGRGV